MNVCGIELKGKDAIICLLSLSDGLFDLPDCRVRRLTLQDINSTEQLKRFQFTFAKLMADYKIERAVIRQRPPKGKFAGGAAGFKMEAAIQLIEEIHIELFTSAAIKETLSQNPPPIPFKETGLKSFQEAAFITAFAYLLR